MSRPARQRVIVTAAAQGIGRVIADAFAAEGAVVRICDVAPAAVEDCRAAAPELGCAVVDLADPAATDAWLDAAIDELGGVDVLVNNAGTKGPTAFVEDITLDEWRSCLAVGLDAQFLCARRVVPIMKQQRSGSIVNMSSMAGVHGFGMRTPYAAAKWAVIGLTKSLAIELGPHGVRCNAICPGSVRGPRMDAVIAAEAELRGVTPQAVADEYVAGQSLKRFVEPEEVAALCLFLASPAASMISGQAIGVDGNTETYHL
jgi:NAD(P)-dependent dehydrogenase (short-subunit alcohol dehydrogenase family)